MVTTNINPNANYFKSEQSGNPLSVMKYVDNKDGTTTNFLNDGSQDTGTYTKNSDGSLTFNRIDVPTTISSETTKPTQNLSLSSTPQDTTNYNATISSIPDYSTILGQINQTTPEDTAVTENKTRLQKIADYITSLGGSIGQTGQIDTSIAKNNAQEQALQQFGYQGSPDAYKQLTDVTNQINALKKEAQAIPLTAEQNAIGRKSILGMQRESQSNLRENAIKSLGLSSIAETIQGNISTAANLAERAVNMQFAPIQAQLNAQMFNYQQNKDALERVDKKQAQALNFTLQERQRLINNAMEDKKLVYDLVLQASKNNAPTLLLTQAQQLDNPTQALSLLGQYMSDPVAKAQALANLQKTRAETSKLNNEIKSQGLNTIISNNNASQYAGALNVILGSTKLTKEQKQNLISSVNNGEDPIATIKNQAKDIMGQTEATKVTNFEVAKAQLDAVNSALNEYYANGGKTDIFRGNFEKVINKLGQVQDPKLVSLAVQISSSLQQYRNAVSGTAYSVQEGKDIASIFPGIDKSEGLNNAILAGRKAAFDATIDASYKTALGSTYYALKQSEIANKPQQPQQQTQVYTVNGVNYVLGQDGKYYPEQTTTQQSNLVTPRDALVNNSGYKGFSLNSLFK